MRERRGFVMLLTAAIAWLAAPQLWLLAQRPIHPPPPPAPAESQQSGGVDNTAGTTAAKRAVLRQNEKEFREGVQHLYELASELRDEVQKTGTIDVLSLRMYRKAEQIEKLAKQLKNRAKGT